MGGFVICKRKGMRCQTVTNKTEIGIELCFSVSAHLWYKLFGQHNSSSHVQEFCREATKKLSPTEHLPEDGGAAITHEENWKRFCSKAAQGNLKAARTAASKLPSGLFQSRLQAALTGHC